MELVPDDILYEIFLCTSSDPATLLLSLCSRRLHQTFLALRPRLAPAPALARLEPALDPFLFSLVFLEKCIEESYLNIIQWAEDEVQLLDVAFLLAEGSIPTFNGFFAPFSPSYPRFLLYSSSFKHFIDF